MKRSLIFLMVLAGTTGCSSLNLLSGACGEDYFFISAATLEAKKNSNFPDDINSFTYGDNITGNYNNSFVLSNIRGEPLLSIFLPITNTGEEDISLVLSMELFSDDSTYYPNTVRTWNTKNVPFPEDTKGRSARIVIEGQKKISVTYFFDPSLLEYNTLDMVVKIGKDEATEPLFETELIQVVRRTNCYDKNRKGFEEVRNINR